jgi:hypothetical protein
MFMDNKSIDLTQLAWIEQLDLNDYIDHICVDEASRGNYINRENLFVLYPNERYEGLKKKQLFGYERVSEEKKELEASKFTDDEIDTSTEVNYIKR